ncbi:hypothetical protein V500_04923 [Pseudogymnoascus sp. VKM F-4518 (FW-2643)]|nr:hypothetical protein V500_04923 [Pseudogymnoascus sp. VKM F-4518 (FW-2643)]
MKPRDYTFIISGGCSGLGLASARELHSAGAYVSLLDLDVESGQSIVKELGDRAKFFKTDVVDTSSIVKAIEGTVKWTKQTGKPFAGVLAAAGVAAPAKIYDGRKDLPVDMSQIDFVMDINVRGTIDLIRPSVPHLAKNSPLTADGERGVLVLVSSSAAFDGQPGQVAYSASKGAIASLTLPLARDLARYGIRAVTIAPSLFESNMAKKLSEKARTSLLRVMEFPARPGNPQEFASLVLECVTNQMLNGTVLRLDGAMRMPSRM